VVSGKNNKVAILAIFAIRRDNNCLSDWAKPSSSLSLILQNSLKASPARLLAILYFDVSNIVNFGLYFHRLRRYHQRHKFTQLF
jgi:hypothetical protein